MSQQFKLDAETTADCLKLIEMALTEDTGSASLKDAVDCTTQSVIPVAATASAAFVSRQEGIVCGVEIAKLALSTFAPDLTLEVVTSDGQAITPGETIAIIRGSAHQILTCLLYTSPSPRDKRQSRMPSSA